MQSLHHFCLAGTEGEQPTMMLCESCGALVLCIQKGSSNVHGAKSYQSSLLYFQSILSSLLRHDYRFEIKYHILQAKVLD
jgi:hypothetical protein